MRKTLVVALAAVLCLSLAATALAQRGDPANTTSTLTAKVSPNNAGTKAKPQRVTLDLGIIGGTKNGQGQPASSTSLNVTLPSGFKINSKSWPSKTRCSLAKMRAEKSPKSCPKGSKVASGVSVAKAGSLTETIKVTGYVLTTGNIGFYLLGNPVPLNYTLDGKVVKSGRGLNVVIPPEVYQPAPGLYTGITKLSLKLKASAKSKGKTIGIVQTTKCPKNKKWGFALKNVLLGGGSINNTASVGCKP